MAQASRCSPRIFVTYHRESHRVGTAECLIPIQVGSGAPINFPCERDNVGVNISQKNNSYCELTALYWIWKSPYCHQSTHLGLLHYRRFFDFAYRQPITDPWGVIPVSSFTYDFQQRFGLTDEDICDCLGDADVVVPKLWDVSQAGCRSIRHHYGQSPHHHERDLAICEQVLVDHSPHLHGHWQQFMASKQGYFNNMFVLRSDLFQGYCQWLFPLLDKIEQRLDISHYTPQEQRVFGYLSERLFNVWFADVQAKNPDLRVTELDRIFVENTAAKCWDPPLPSPSQTRPRIASIVIASDNNYVPHLAALLMSLFDSTSKSYILDILVLDGGITPSNQLLLKRLVPPEHQLSLIPMQDAFNEHFVHMHFSKTTFYRLVLDSLLASRQKVIYIDCDTIVLGDVAELAELDLGDAPLAAVPDVIMHHFCRSQILSADFTGSLPAADYLSRYLGFDPDQCQTYFQAGLLVMNLAAMRRLNYSDRMIADLGDRKYWFLDQDILNKYYASSYFPLSYDWNYVNCQSEILNSLPPDLRCALASAGQQPKLIHYAGYEAKPWVNRGAFMAEHYFFYLRQTFWYEFVISPLSPARSESTSQLRTQPLVAINRLARQLWPKLPVQLRRVMNPIAHYLANAIKTRLH